MKKLLTGNQAAAWGIMCCRANAVTTLAEDGESGITEELASLIGKGWLNAHLVRTASDYSAMIDGVGSEAAASAFIIGPAQELGRWGLTHQHDHEHNAVVAVCDVEGIRGDCVRMSLPFDSLAQRDAGWLQYYCESGQEVIDTVIQAHKVVERLHLPVMVALDDLFLAQAYEAVEVPELDKIGKFLSIPEPDITTKTRHEMDVHNRQREMSKASKLCCEIDKEFNEIFGRKYGLVEAYRCEGADLVVIVNGSMSSTARVVVEELRGNGGKVGLLKMRLLRPFPAEEVRTALKNIPKAAVIDRDCSVGLGGIWAQEIKAALYGLHGTERPEVVEYIAGAGSADVTLENIRWILEDAARREGGGEPVWVESN